MAQVLQDIQNNQFSNYPRVITFVKAIAYLRYSSRLSSFEARSLAEFCLENGSHDYVEYCLITFQSVSNSQFKTYETMLTGGIYRTP
jgi:hypothetical protein